MVRPAKHVNMAGLDVEVLSDAELQEAADSEDGLAIVCMRITDATVVVPRSSKSLCQRCQEPIWVSPATQQSKPSNARLLCLQCAASIGAFRPDSQVTTSEGVIAEVRKAISE